MRASFAACGCALLFGCGSGSESEPPIAEVPVECADALELLLPDGSCIRPGVPPDGCAAGFAHDGEYGCEPILPEESCPTGLMAVPGETACRPVMPCGEGKWGDIPIDGDTMYVDQSYAGIDSDGSETRPWLTIGDAVSRAAPDATIAIAEGSYVEDVVVAYKSVRLWGVCPDKVEVVGAGAEIAALAIRSSGSEVHGLALRGAPVGIVVNAGENVVIDRVHVHDTQLWGMDLEASLGPTSVSIVGALVEQSHQIGIYLGGAQAEVEATVVRAIMPPASGDGAGLGIQVQPLCTTSGCFSQAPANAVLRGSLIEKTHRGAVSVVASDVLVDSTVIRDTLPDAIDQTNGRAINVELCTLPSCDGKGRAVATVRGSVIENNHEVGLSVIASDATIESTVVRGTAPRASDAVGGRGINVQLGCDEGVCDPATRANATLRTSLVEQNHDVGVLISGSDAVLESIVVRRTSPQASDGMFGRGLGISLSCTQFGCDPLTRSTATVRGSLIEESHEIGLDVGESDAFVEATVVRGTRVRAFDGYLGDGLAAISDVAPATAVVDNARIEQSARAGVSSFGAFVSLRQTLIGCAAFPLNGERWGEHDFTFENRGGNACGCPTPDGSCAMGSAGLTPPAPIAQ